MSLGEAGFEHGSKEEAMETDPWHRYHFFLNDLIAENPNHLQNNTQAASKALTQIREELDLTWSYDQFKARFLELKG